VHAFYDGVQLPNFSSKNINSSATESDIKETKFVAKIIVPLQENIDYQKKRLEVLGQLSKIIQESTLFPHFPDKSEYCYIHICDASLADKGFFGHPNLIPCIGELKFDKKFVNMDSKTVIELQYSNDRDYPKMLRLAENITKSFPTIEKVHIRRFETFFIGTYYDTIRKCMVSESHDMG
jgi:hypothetical protein